MTRSNLFASLAIATLLGAATAQLGQRSWTVSQPPTIEPALAPTTPQPASSPVQLAQLSTSPTTPPPTFVDAAKIATPAVVHIKAKYEAKEVQNPNGISPFERLFKEFFGEEFEIPREYKSQPKQATGSGVIITEDGYIVTNHHVIEGADTVEVTLDDNRRYTAKVIGQDPDTDLALLKIKQKGLSFLNFGNSDQLQVGEWILAVGNPFNLTSTVTKGIVSAKARTINIAKNKGQMRIEAFIQTDAAVNKGNSGGALVNLRGELVGINTAIFAPTGSFTGYSFAIPSSIVEKVIKDLKKYGVVNRAMLGVAIRNVDADLAEEKKIKQLRGVYIAEVNVGSAAAAAGLQAGDVIVAVNGKKVKNTSQLQEQIALYKPKDKVRVTFFRNNKEKTVTVVLQNVTESTQIVVHQDKLKVGGAILKNIDEATCKQLEIAGGVCVSSVGNGPWKKAGIQKGFIITAIDRQPIQDLKQLAALLDTCKEGILVEGFLAKGKKCYYGVDLGTN